MFGCTKTNGNRMAALLGMIVLGAAFFTWRVSAMQPADKPFKLEGNIGQRLNQLQLDAAMKELVEAVTDLRKEQVQMAFLKSNEKTIFETPIPDGTIDEAVNRDPAVEKLQEQLAELRENIEKIRKTAAEGKADQAVREIQKQMANLEINVDARRKSLRPRIIDQLRSKDRQEYHAKISQHEVHISYLKEYEKALLADIQRYAGEK